MQTVILAGGLGTRLRPLTEQTPKPMVEVGGRPFLEYIVDHLAGQRFTDIILLTGHLGEHISDHFGDGAKFGVSIRYSHEAQPLGTGGAVRAAWNQLSDQFLLIYGDSFLPIDYGQVSLAFRECCWPALMVTYDNRAEYADVRNNIGIDQSGCVVRYEKGVADPELTQVDAGVLCFKREVFSGLPACIAASLEHELFPKLIAARQMGAFSTSQRFYDIGTPARLQEFTMAQLCLSLAPHFA